MPPGDAEAGLQGVVVRLAGGVLLQDVEGTVREVIADVVAQNTVGSRDGTPRTGNGRDTIGTVRRRDLRLAGLADVEEPPEAMPLRPNVANLQYCLAGNLLLDIQVVIL